MLLVAMFTIVWIFMLFATITSPKGVMPYLPEPTKKELDEAYKEKQKKEDA